MVGPVRVGCCGWSYKEWVGPFYRTADRMLTQYIRVFDTVEMDSTFYRVPDEQTMRGIARVLPKGFCFTVKLPGAITHEAACRKTERAEAALAQFVRALEPLREHGSLSLVLVQLAPSFTSDKAADLEALLGTLRDLGLRTATEFRHPSWLEPDRVEGSLRLLRRTASSYTVVDEPLLPSVVHRTAPPVYVRMHGRNPAHWYDYAYSEEELAEWAGRVREVLEEGDEVIVVFNNHPHGNAPRNARRFRELLGLTPGGIDLGTTGPVSHTSDRS